MPKACSIEACPNVIKLFLREIVELEEFRVDALDAQLEPERIRFGDYARFVYGRRIAEKSDPGFARVDGYSPQSSASSKAGLVSTAPLPESTETISKSCPQSGQLMSSPDTESKGSSTTRPHSAHGNCKVTFCRCIVDIFVSLLNW